MSIWPFLAFTAVLVAVIYLHFAVAHSQWKKPSYEPSSEVDSEYVRAEDFFGRSFRLKVKEWLQLPSAPCPDTAGRLIKRGREHILVLPQLDCHSGGSSDDVLVVETDFSCGPRCTFSREIYVRRRAEIGAGGRLQAIAADGDLVLGPSVTVTRWVDAAGVLEIGEGSIVRGRATSRTAIRLKPGAEVSSVYGPEVSTLGCEEAAGEAAYPLAVGEDLVCLPPDSTDPTAGLKSIGLDPNKLRQLSADCWLYDGDLEMAAPLKLKSKLVVRGTCSCTAGSVLEDDLKAAGNLRVGEDSVCRGNLAAAGAIYLGARTRFHGAIQAGKTLQLCRGVRGYSESGPVAAYAAEALYVENNVLVRGKLAAGERVVAVSAVPAPRPAEAKQEAAAAGRQRAAVAALRLLACAAMASPVLLLAQQPATPPPVAEASSSTMPPVRLELGGFGSAVDRGFGSWRGSEGQLWVRASSRFIPAFAVESQTRPGGSQENYSFLSYLNWNKSFYTVQSFSIAPQRNSQAIYFPERRYDLKGFWKLPPPRNLVLAAGFTSFRFSQLARGQIFNIGSLYYRNKLVVEGNLFINRSQPGDLYSGSGSVAAQYGQEGAYWLGVTASGGRELYRFVGAGPQELRFSGYSLRLSYRRWISHHVGFVSFLDYQEKLDAYRRVGAGSRLFFEF